MSEKEILLRSDDPKNELKINQIASGKEILNLSYFTLLYDI